MNEKVVQDSLKIASELFETSSKSDNGLNYWMWLAIVECGIIIFLALKRKKSNHTISKKKFKDESLNENIDFGNLINSSFNSLQLYDELKVKCHPDRFPTDMSKNAIAESLFQEISKNKTDIKKLQELKEEAKQKLNINF